MLCCNVLKAFAGSCERSRVGEEAEPAHRGVWRPACNNLREAVMRIWEREARPFLA